MGIKLFYRRGQPNLACCAAMPGQAPEEDERGLYQAEWTLLRQPGPDFEAWLAWRVSIGPKPVPGSVWCQEFFPGSRPADQVDQEDTTSSDEADTEDKKTVAAPEKATSPSPEEAGGGLDAEAPRPPTKKRKKNRSTHNTSKAARIETTAPRGASKDSTEALGEAKDEAMAEAKTALEAAKAALEAAKVKYETLRVVQQKPPAKTAHVRPGEEAAANEPAASSKPEQPRPAETDRWQWQGHSDQKPTSQWHSSSRWQDSGAKQTHWAVGSAKSEDHPTSQWQPTGFRWQEGGAKKTGGAESAKSVAQPVAVHEHGKQSHPEADNSKKLQDEWANWFESCGSAYKTCHKCQGLSIIVVVFVFYGYLVWLYCYWCWSKLRICLLIRNTMFFLHLAWRQQSHCSSCSHSALHQVSVHCVFSDVMQSSSK